MAQDVTTRSLSARVVRHLNSPGRAFGLALSLLTRRWRQYDHQRNSRRLKAEASKFAERARRSVGAPGGYVVFGHLARQRPIALYALFAHYLAKDGLYPLFMFEGLRLSPSADPRLSSVDGALIQMGPQLIVHKNQPCPDRLSHSWEIDLPNGILATGGTNYYPTLLQTLRKDLRRYTIDYGTPETQRLVKHLIKSIDSAVTVCEDVLELAQTSGKPIRISLPESFYVPGGVFLIFCKEVGYKAGVEFVEFGLAYTQFFTGKLLYNFSDRYTLRNLTRTRAKCRLDVLPEEFERFLESDPDKKEVMREAQVVVNHNRTLNPALPEDASAVVRRIEEHRAAGGRVLCLFGHVAYDMYGIHDVGFAHADMADWATDTVRSLAGTDILLLIKPHIAEKLVRTRNRRPREAFAELIREPLPDNAILLDALWFNPHQLFPLIDGGLVWRSSVGLELSVAKVPTIVACPDAYYLPVLPLPTPKDRADYRRLLLSIWKQPVSDETALRAALVMRYMQGQFVHVPEVSSRDKDLVVGRLYYDRRLIAENDNATLGSGIGRIREVFREGVTPR